MRTPEYENFSPEIKDKLYRVAQFILSYRLLEDPASNVDEHQLDRHLFAACIALREAIGDEDINDLIVHLGEIAESANVNIDKVMVLFMSAQSYYLIELKHVEEAEPQPPNMRLMGEIFFDINSGKNPHEVLRTITLKLAEIFKAQTNIDMHNMLTRLMDMVSGTPFEQELNICLIRAQDMAIREIKNLTALAKSEVGETRAFFSNRVISE